MKRILIALVLVFALAVGVILSSPTAEISAEPGGYSMPPPEQEIIEVIRTEYIVETVTEYIEIPVEIEIPVPVGLEDWETLEELEAFVEEDTPMIVLHAGPGGTINFNGRCEVAALQLIDRAAEIGKRLFFLPLSPDEYKKWYGSYPEPRSAYHAIVGALVGDNEFYYIEPSNDRVWLAILLEEDW